ncbi:hypothetical protein X773_18520 [Mesorhizobium sp. LSJC285A00]|nr:hypothetical protein X773_18520 [Mesorhizobium sp. LSJC285A00]
MKRETPANEISMIAKANRADTAQTRSATLRVTAATLPGERIIRKLPDQYPGIRQVPLISVASPLMMPL